MQREVEKEAYKRIPFEILCYVADFCEKNGIRYSLAYGTLLGAIRHKGFIPWDDDIDIIMPRADYERFKNLYHSERYPFSDIAVNTNHPTDMAKVYDSQTCFYNSKVRSMRSYGLFVDIFVVDNFPVNNIERKQWQKRTKLLMAINKAKNSSLNSIIHLNKTFLGKLKRLIYKLIPISKKVIQKRIVALSQKYNGEYTGIVGVTMSQDNPYDTYPAVLFEEYIDVTFEGYKFKAIRDYDKWLSVCYGDYMQLPPEEKRKGKHGVVAYYKE